MKISSDAKIILNKYKEEINSGNFKLIYNDFLMLDDARLTSEISQIFLNSGINPLNYLDEVPANFLTTAEIDSITIPNGITKIKNFAFSGTKLTRIEIPNSVTYMGINVFQDCKELKSITFSNALKAIPKNACLDCTSLSYVEIPEGVEKIMQRAFFGCDKLNNVTIPKSIKFIDVVAFPDNLEELTYSGTIAEFRKIAIDNFYDDDYKALDNVVVHCADGDTRN